MLSENRCPLIPLLTLLVGSAAAWPAGAAEIPRQDIVAVEERVPLFDRRNGIEANANAPTEQAAAPAALPARGGKP